MAVLALAPPSWVQQGSNLLFTLWMATALFQLTHEKRHFIAIAILGWTPALLDLLVPQAATPVALQIAKQVSWAAFPLVLSVLLLRPLLAARVATRNEFAGALAIYILIGIGFANIYEIYFDVNPATISFAHTALGDAPVFTDFLYFSFVTLATLGYGDVSPVSPVARLTSVLEAVVGLLYVAILVGRMVGLGLANAPPDPGSAQRRNDSPDAH